MRKPINIIYEVAFFIAFERFLAICSRLNLFPEGILTDVYGYQIYIGFVLLNISIMARAFHGKQNDKVLISTFLFGLIYGTYYWFLFGLSESEAIGVLTLLGGIVVSLVVGAITGTVAVLLSYISSGLYRLFKKSK